MDWTNDFLIPVTKLTFLIFIFGFILFVIIRAIYIKWNKKWKWAFKYKTKKCPINKDMLIGIEGMTDGEIKKNLLLNNFTIKQINELLYIKKLIGGKTNVK